MLDVAFRIPDRDDLAHFDAPNHSSSTESTLCLCRTVNGAHGQVDANVGWFGAPEGSGHTARGHELHGDPNQSRPGPPVRAALVLSVVEGSDFQVPAREGLQQPHRRALPLEGGPRTTTWPRNRRRWLLTSPSWSSSPSTRDRQRGEAALALPRFRAAKAQGSLERRQGHGRRLELRNSCRVNRIIRPLHRLYRGAT